MGSISPETLANLQRARYVGSALHKKGAGDYGFNPAVNPRPGKSVCDDLRTINLREATALFRAGIQSEMVSGYLENGHLPKFVWAVDHAGEAYEAKLGDDGSSYHWVSAVPGPTDASVHHPPVERTEPMITTDLQIGLAPELLEEGPDYERAAFGRLEIAAGTQMLAALVEADGNRRNYQPGPYVSGYHFAEWLVWNWWRLRWEPRSSVDRAPSFEWDMAHRMSDIGEGYLWPNITISCDGFQCDLISERSNEQDTPLFSYIGAPPVTVPATDFENAIDQFVTSVLLRLDGAGIANTNLQTLWEDLSTERHDPEIARFRHIEALLGFDPDEVDEAHIASWLKDAQLLGASALDELATGAANSMLSARQIADATASVGFDMNANDTLRLDYPLGMQWGRTAAWRVGVAVANAVREQAGLTNRPITSPRLSELAGVSNQVFESAQCTNSLSWVFHPTQRSPRIALRQRRQTGRRFDLARLIGDRLFSENSFTPEEPLSPATRSYSYRQKAQRAFAAELLSPWDAVRAMLEHDYSPDNQEQIAEYFGVSPLTISTLLVNNEGYSRDNHGEPDL